jgi:hypothetical protein
MSRTRSEMIGMTLRKFPMVRNTSYYGVQVVHCVRRLRGYRKSSKTTKYALRAVACVSAYTVCRTQTVSPPCFGTALWTVWLAMITEDQYNDMEMASLASVHQEAFGHPEIEEYAGGF